MFKTKKQKIIFKSITVYQIPPQSDLSSFRYAFSFNLKTNMQSNQISYERHGNLIHCYILISGKKKLIGIINEITRTLSKKISMTTHTFNKSHSIAIAYELLKLDYDYIEIECGYNTYKTTRKFFLEHSTFKQFTGFELQKFLPINLFGIERAESWEKEQTLKVKNIPAMLQPEKAVYQMEMF